MYLLPTPPSWPELQFFFLKMHMYLLRTKPRISNTISNSRRLCMVPKHYIFVLYEHKCLVLEFSYVFCFKK